jgi:hypothetical protein
MRASDGIPHHYEPAISALERAALRYRPPWVAVLAEILLDEIVAHAWPDGQRDAAQLLIGRLERLAPGREGAA